MDSRYGSTKTEPLASTSVSEPFLPKSTLISVDKTLNKSSKAQKYLAYFLSICLLGLIGLSVYFSSKKHSLSSTKPGIFTNVYQSTSSDDGYTLEALEDLNTYLPGVEDMDTLGFKSFSGYLTILDNDGIEKKMFYWFVESQNDPDNDPLLMWTNGGPGCSGLMGMNTEHGPFWTAHDDIYLNPSAYNQISNVIYIEQPYGVGFSIPTEGYVVGDYNAAYEMYMMSIAFVEKFPKFAENDFYLISESWGGHYMPITAKTILEGNDAGLNRYVNFKGFWVGNPYTDYSENTIGWMRALYGHGMLTNELWNEWSDSCVTQREIDDEYYCDYLYVESEYQVGDINFYGLDYPECLIDDIDDASGSTVVKSTSRFKDRFRNKLMELHAERAVKSSKLSTAQKSMLEDKLSSLKQSKVEAQSKFKEYQSKLVATQKRRKLGSLEQEDAVMEPYITCIDLWQDYWLNRADVQEALHVEGADGSTIYTWSECSDDVFDNWPVDEYFTHMEDIYIELVEKYDIRIAVMSGDDDSVCAMQGTMWWLDLITDWTKDDTYSHYTWNDDLGQVGGFYTKFLATDSEGNEKTAVNYITVRSVGHEVPEYKPQRALKVLEFFLNDFENIDD